MKKIIGGAAAVAVAVFGGVGAFGDETVRDDAGMIIEGGGLGAFSIREGDCFNFPDAQLIVSLEAVPCREPHDAEVYALFNQSGTAWPGEVAVGEASDTGCWSRFQAFVGVPYELSELDFWVLEPTKESWEQLDDRETACSVVSMDGTKLTGSMRGARI